MTLFRSLAAALLLLLAATPAHAQDKISVGDWDIFTNQSNCSAIATFGEATTVWIAFTAKTDRATMMLMDDKVFAGVKDGAPFDAQLAFVKGEELDTQWMSLPVTGAVIDTGAKGVMIRAPGNAFLTSLSESQFFGLLKGSEAVISIKTNDISNVISALRSCSAKIK